MSQRFNTKLRCLRTIERCREYLRKGTLVEWNISQKGDNKQSDL